MVPSLSPPKEAEHAHTVTLKTGICREVPSSPPWAQVQKEQKSAQWASPTHSHAKHPLPPRPRCPPWLERCGVIAGWVSAKLEQKLTYLGNCHFEASLCLGTVNEGDQLGLHGG